MAEWDSRPPLSVTMAPSSGSRMLNASVVASVTRTSPWTIRPNSEGPETRLAPPLVDALAGRQPAEEILVVLFQGTAEYLAHGDTGGPHETAHGRWQS